MKSAITTTLDTGIVLKLKRYAQEREMKLSQALNTILSAFFSGESTTEPTDDLKAIKKEIIDKSIEMAELKAKEKDLLTEQKEAEQKVIGEGFGFFGNDKPSKMDLMLKAGENRREERKKQKNGTDNQV